MRVGQQALIQTFKQRISQGCSLSASLFAHFLGQSLDWTDFESPMQSQLLFDAIDIAVLYPRPQILHQI